MDKLEIYGQPLPNMPWEERNGQRGVMWRDTANPIIPRDLLPDSNSIFNSAVVPFAGGFERQCHKAQGDCLCLLARRTMSSYRRLLGW